MTAHWFSLFSQKLPNLQTHLLSTSLPQSLSSLPADLKSQLRNRSMLVRRLKIFPIESIVRGYITGSGWAEYKRTGTVHGIKMPTGLQESQKLEKPLWTPSTKAEVGGKDENISPEQAREIVGEKYAAKIEEYSIRAYEIVSTDLELQLNLSTKLDNTGTRLRRRARNHHRRHQIRIWS